MCKRNGRGVWAFAWTLGTASAALLPTPALAQANQIAVGRAMWVVAPFPTLDITADVGQLCDGKPSCQFVLSPQTFGGKSPQGTGRHQLIVQYRCGTAGKNGLAYDNDTVTLSCP